MTPIAERLRAEALTCSLSDREALMNEAADTLERQQGALETITSKVAAFLSANFDTRPSLTEEDVQIARSALSGGGQKE